MNRLARHPDAGRAVTVCAALCALLAAARCGQAQPIPPQPIVTYVYPAGAGRGQTVEVTVHGSELQNAEGVRLTGNGVTASVLEAADANSVRIAVTVESDAPEGERDLRVITPGGISNRLRFAISSTLETNEVEPNTDRSQPQLISVLPALINGQILDNDRDCFRFVARAGQTIVCHVQARTLLPYLPDTVPGFLDASLTLFDPQGRALLTEDRFRHHPDPVLVYHVAEDGEYTLEVSDVIYRGRSDFVYRLTITEGSLLTDVYPLGGQRNADLEVQLAGINLPAKTLPLVVSPNRGDYQVIGPLDGAPASNYLLFDVADDPETCESEPNEAHAHATRVQAPVIVNGRIQSPGDEDYFVLAVEANQVLALDVRARRLGSPLDSVLSVMNAAGGLLAENDDDVDPDFALLLHHADSRLVFTFPEAGDYLLRVRDAQGRGGPEYAYRLAVTPPRPDYRLQVTPDRQRMHAGDSAVVTLTAQRRNGLDGDIHVSVGDLPAGFSSSGAIIPAGLNQATLTITAPHGASPQIVSPAMVGHARVGEQLLTRTAFGAEDVMQAFSYRHMVPTQEYVLAVLPGSHFTLSLPATTTAPLQLRP